MPRRVEILALAIALGAALSSGCIAPWTVSGTLFPEGARPPAEAPTKTAAAQRPSLPPDWSISETARADAGIKQVGYPEEAREREATASEAKAAAPPRKAPAAAEPPENLPKFEIHTKPEDPLIAALRCFLDKRPAEAVDYLKGYDKTNQEALLCLLPLTARLGQESLDRARPEEAAELIDALHGVEVPLQRRAPLRIDKMCFCRWIKDFGRYEPLAVGQAKYEAGCNGRPGEPVYVYAEVRNFATASKDKEPWYEVHLASRAEVRDSYAGGKVAAVIDFDNGGKVDYSRSPREDFFINYSFRVPKNLAAGHYTLWIYVKDELQPDRPPAQRSLDFEVIASGSARGSRGEPGGLAAR
jgi:hypothetical protein